MISTCLKSESKHKNQPACQSRQAGFFLCEKITHFITHFYFNYIIITINDKKIFVINKNTIDKHREIVIIRV